MMSQFSEEISQEETIAYWQPIITAWRESKLSAKDYCKQHRLSSRQFKYWQYELLPKQALQGEIESTFTKVKTKPAKLLNDTNNITPAIELITPLVLCRKNYLFFGSHESGKHAAIIYSLIATCKQHNINTYDYFKDVLTRLRSQKINKIDELLPYNWK